MNRLMFLMIAMMLPATVSQALVPAFPGAEGFGAYTPGGRGGQIIEVTNLNDSGPGSFRAACEASGPRIVVFRVGGVIRLKSHLRITKPFITIAGQTAPGDGIMLRDAGLLIETHDVVVRYIRVRIGQSMVERYGSQDPLHIGPGEYGTYNVVVDHCSFSWSMDEVADAYGNVTDFTIQWCIISEALREGVPGRSHSMALLLGKPSTRSSIHHNLLAHCNTRNPRIQGGRRDIINNVIYNWGGIAAMFSRNPEVNFIGNYYKPGPNTNSRTYMIVGDELGSIFLKDNEYPGEHASQWDLVETGKGAVRAERRHYAPFVTTYPAREAYDRVLESAGCSFPRRDAVDERVIRDVREGTGKIIDTPEEVGGFPEIVGGEPPSDADHDGMPDEWENSHGLNPADGSDSSGDLDGDGYTNIEEYINGLVAFQP